ncbi:MAG: plastocyanin/azurin family copper-binding protein [Rhodanobacteraceae bacterium]
MRYSIAIVASVIALAALPAFAVDHMVTVGGRAGPVFTPPSLTINVGDTVTFHNSGGLHNVRSDPDAVTSFRCSDDCSNGASSANLWTDTITFRTAGTVGYYCEEHGSPRQGMYGTITVQDAAAPPPPPPSSFTVGGYISGNWYNTAQSGQGFQIEAATNNTMVAIWFVFAPDGSAQNWIYAQGNYDTSSNTATLQAVLLTGAAFPPNFDSSDLTNTPWGTLTFTFSDCNNGTASWNSPLPGYGIGSLPITRLTQIDGTSCPQ